ncbi:nucleotide exchange factor GrpE [Streptomyces sp. CSDS2]|uniref:nucleotide exchange factor GrpE n=1 Tax=Streptomyces sp. CSDS2 TaxID=3055051 RepID=UPI0025B08FD2|nr:nucleotide exchange factor GrpE [Streptomyces sp. CSDS2]MDN3263146.1 nucleotide exchange factor GrpE [Streptomyces sp. CSDS2]
MTGPNGTGRRGRPALSVVGDTRRREPGNSLEPRRRGDVEPARQPVRTAGEAAEAAVLRARLRECTADLRRVRAEYDAYRGRVGRDRLAVREIAVANVLTGLLPVLDAIDQAHKQGEVTGGFRRVTEVLESELAALGLRSFGTAGDPFDPAVHEAVSCTFTAGVRQPICAVVLRPGYRIGDQLLRPAQVEVAEPVRT